MYNKNITKLWQATESSVNVSKTMLNKITLKLFENMIFILSDSENVYKGSYALDLLEFTDSNITGTIKFLGCNWNETLEVSMSDYEQKEAHLVNILASKVSLGYYDFILSSKNEFTIDLVSDNIMFSPHPKQVKKSNCTLV